jgi:hypothetical protein
MGIALLQGTTIGPIVKGVVDFDPRYNFLSFPFQYLVIYTELLHDFCCFGIQQRQLVSLDE